MCAVYVAESAAFGLADFGIAKLREETGLLVTAPTAVFGTPGYMSPEQCQRTADVDSRSDIYSLGCVLYEMVTGRLPYAGTANEQMRQASSNAPIIPPSKLRRDTPKVLEDTIVKCLAFRREDRFATAVEVIRNIAAGVENGEAKMGFFAPHLIEDVALGPTANTVSASVGPALTKYAQAAHSAIRRTRRRALLMFLAGGVVGSVAVGTTMTLITCVPAGAPSTSDGSASDGIVASRISDSPQRPYFVASKAIDAVMPVGSSVWMISSSLRTRAMTSTEFALGSTHTPMNVALVPEKRTSCS